MTSGLKAGNVTQVNILSLVIDPASANEYSTNGAFATDTGWTKGAGWTIAAGVATATGAISTALSQTAAQALQSGAVYTVTFTTSGVSAGSVAVSLGGGTAGTSRSTSATFTEAITAGATQIIAFTGSGFTGNIDNVTIFNPANEQTFTLSGAKVGDLIFFNKPTLDAGFGIGGARVTARDTVAINFVNPTAAVINPGSETWNLMLVRAELDYRPEPGIRRDQVAVGIAVGTVSAN